MGRGPNTPGGRPTLRAKTNEVKVMKINEKSWVTEERLSEVCSGKSDQNRKEFRGK